MRVIGGLLKNSPERIPFSAPRLTCKARNSAAGSAPGKSTTMRSGPVMAWVSGATDPEVCISTSIAAPLPLTSLPRTMTCWTRGLFAAGVCAKIGADDKRSEEHTSELQSHLNLVCRLLLEKKKKLKKSPN